MDEEEFLQFFKDEEQEDEQEEECNHETTQHINGAIICNFCGTELEQIYVVQDNTGDGGGKKYFRKKTQNSEGSVSCDCRVRGFSDEISDMADRKYQIMMQKASSQGIPETHRGRPRKALICSCIFFSMMLRGQTSITLLEIGSKFGIYHQTKLGTGKDIYLKFFPEDANIRQKPIHLIPNIMKKAGIDLQYLKYIEAIMKTLENRSAIINASKQMSVAATMIFIFLKLNPEIQKELGYENVKTFAKKIKMSNITISRKSECGLAILEEMQKIKEQKVQS